MHVLYLSRHGPVLFPLVAHLTCWWNLGRTVLRFALLKSPVLRKTTEHIAIGSNIFT